MKHRAAVCAVALFLIVPGIAGAAERLILGKKLIVRDAGGEQRRVIVGLGRSSPSSFTGLSGITSGATLIVMANGGTSTAQVFTLDASGWTAIPNGVRYTGPTTGDPVKRVILKQIPLYRLALLKVILRGRVGTTDLDVVP